jgi:hypothetical protein
VYTIDTGLTRRTVRAADSSQWIVGLGDECTVQGWALSESLVLVGVSRGEDMFTREKEGRALGRY